MSPPSLTLSGPRAIVAREFGATLKRLRKEKGWIQETFAQEMGISRTTLSNMERGVQRVFLDHAYEAARILRIPVKDILPEIDGFGNKHFLRGPSDDPLSDDELEAVRDIVRELTP